MTFRGNGFIYSILAVLVSALLAACVDQEQPSRVTIPTSTPIPAEAQETTIEQTAEQATETPFAQAVASPPPVRAPLSAARLRVIAIER